MRDDCAQTRKVNRNSLITMKDLSNIERDYNIKGNIQRHPTDAASIQLWVEECKKRPESNPVLYFKEQDVDDPLKRFEKKDYVLIIMSKFQKEMLSKFGFDKICIDGTHGTNSYEFTLHTLLIIDEFNNRCPVAFCISNSKTQVLYKTFFEYVKDETGSIKSKLFMSDDELAYYNAWQEVMGESEYRLMCTWHLYENWKKNLGKIPGSETKKEVFRLMKILQKETDVDNFNAMLSNFIRELGEDERLHAFRDYFVKTYSKRCEMRAACFRKYLGLNTNMHLESLHKRIKYHYLDGTCNRRLDLTIDALLKMIRDFAFQRMIKITKQAPHAKIKQIDANHQRSHGLSFNAVAVEESKTSETMKWSVISATRNDVTYIVESTTTACNCNYRCSACNICIHSFTCSCLNNVISFTICKHIHAVAKSLVVEDPAQSVKDDQSSNVDSNLQKEVLESLVSLLPQKEVFTGSSSLQTNLESLMGKVMKLQLSKIDEKKFEELHRNVNKCLLICDALQLEADSKNKDDRKNKEKQKENSSLKKITKQKELY